MANPAETEPPSEAEPREENIFRRLGLTTLAEALEKSYELKDGQPTGDQKAHDALY